MTYDFECVNCGWEGERFVHTFEESNNQVCDHCGERLERLISATSNISVWNHNSIPEIDENIRFRGMRHAREVANAKGLKINPDPIKPFELDYRKRQTEKDEKRPISVDYGRREKKTKAS